MGRLTPIDWIVATTSVVAVFGAALYSSCRKTVDGADAGTRFFLAGRAMPWWISAASIFASNIGTEHFVGQAGLAATSGIAVTVFEWAAGYLLLLLGWVFGPVYLRLGLRTMPEYLERRFDHRCRAWFVLLTLVSYVLSKLGSTLFSGAVVLDVLTGLDIWSSTALILFATAVYTAAGGLRAVMWTDTVQSVIFVVGGTIGGVFALDAAGGMDGVRQTLKERELSWFLHMLHPANDKDMPWPGMMIGLTFGTALYYWCLDQEMAQRVLSAESLDHAQLACTVAGYFKFLPFLITVLPGVVARVLYEKCRLSEGVEFGEWCAEGAADMSDASDSNKAYPLLVLREFPVGVKGVMVASFLSAMMSSLSSVFNSASTVLTYDIYLRFFHAHDEVEAKSLVSVGRATTVMLTVLSLLWLPVIQASNDGLYLVTQNATAHLAATISAVFTVGILWPRANAAGAFFAFVTGTVLSLIRLVLTIILEDYCDDYTRDEDGRTILRTTWGNWFVCMNFNHYAILNYGYCFLAITTVVSTPTSLCTAPPNVASLFVWPRSICRLSTRRRLRTETGKSLLPPSPGEASPSQSAEQESVASDAARQRRGNIAAVLGVLLLVCMTTAIGVMH